MKSEATDRLVEVGRACAEWPRKKVGRGGVDGREAGPVRECVRREPTASQLLPMCTLNSVRAGLVGASAGG